MLLLRHNTINWSSVVNFEKQNDWPFTQKRSQNCKKKILSSKNNCLTANEIFSQYDVVQGYSGFHVTKTWC